MGYNPQESLENTINTLGTLLGERSHIPPLELGLNSCFFWGGKDMFMAGKPTTP